MNHQLKRGAKRSPMHVLIPASAATWLAIAVLLSAQAQIVGAWEGRYQAWWPSLGYSVAIFSVWAMLTPALVLATQRVQARVQPLWGRALVYAAALPCTVALHVFMFAALFWPIYSDGGRIPSRWAMARTMFGLNFQSSTVIYVAVISVGILLERLATRTSGSRPSIAPAAQAPIPVRIRGGTRLVTLDEIDWIVASHGYAELHGADRSWLADETLAGLEERLPKDVFGRVHRNAIVRLERIVEVRGTGHGDGELLLRGGAKVRLSRRYRASVTKWLKTPG